MIGLPKGDVAPTGKSDMAAPALAQGVGTGATAAPASQLRWLVVGVACVAALGSIRLAFASDQLSEHCLQAALLNWVTLPFIVEREIACVRRAAGGPSAAPRRRAAGVLLRARAGGARGSAGRGCVRVGRLRDDSPGHVRGARPGARGVPRRAPERASLPPGYGGSPSTAAVGP